MALTNYRLVILGLFACVALSAGQERTYTIKGSVVDSLSGERLPYATLRIEGSSIGTYTNDQGYFVLPGVPVQLRRIIVSDIGYKERIYELKRNTPIVEALFQILPEPTTFSPVEVTGQYKGQMKPVAPSTTVFYPSDIARANGLFNNDIVQAVTQLPGIVTVGGMSNQYYVRGGAADQNLVTIDGIRVYNLFHAFGLFSLIDPLIVKVADFSSGGFQAQYGGRLSSVLDVETRDGDMHSYNAAGSFDLLSTDIMLSGPVPLGILGNSSSFVGFFRTSLYRNALGRYFGKNMPFQFFDGFGKLTSDFTSTGHISIEYFSTGDQITSSNPADPNYSWRDIGFALSGNYLFSNQYSLRFSVSTSQYRAEQIPQSSNYLYYESDKIIDPAFFGELTYYPSPGSQLDFGLLFTFPSYNFTFTNAFNIPLIINDQEVEPNMWMKYKWELIKDLDAELGMRFDLSRAFALLSGAGKGYVGDPRATLTYNFSPDASLYLTAGEYHQRIISLNNEDDIYTPFELIVPIPESSSNLSDEEAYHYILGGRFAPLNVFGMRAEVYYKDFAKLVTANRNKIDKNDPDFIMGSGVSYGLEVTGEYDVGTMYLSGGYSYAKVTENSAGFEFFPRYDRRHQVNISSGWMPPPGFWLRAHWEFGSGLPYTALNGFYPQLVIDPTNLSGYPAGLTTSQLVFGQKNSARMPAYERLDLSASYRMSILGMDCSSELMLINVFDRKNVFYIDNVSGDVEYSLPFIVNLSLKWNLK